MSAARGGESAFLHSQLLRAEGVEHGLGTRESETQAPADLALACQVHGNRTLRVPPLPGTAEADALWSDAPGTGVAVRTADCVPLLIAAPGGRVVAAVHAGWRGSAARIAECAVLELVGSAQIAPSALVAAIGPHIGPCCYEVDEPVRAAVEAAIGGAPTVSTILRPGRPGHFWLDLGALNRIQLERVGLRSERIEQVGGCTACEPGRYPSYRRDGSTARMLHYVRVPA